MDNHGFTLVELLITLTLLVILVALGSSGFSAQIQSNRVKTTAISLQEAVALTRSQAVFANRRTTIKAREQWQNGWDIFIDNNSNGIREEDEKLLASGEISNRVRIIANQPIKHYISYTGTGESRLESRRHAGGFQAGTFSICPLDEGDGYQLILSRGGRMRMSEIDAAKCAEEKQ